MLVTESWLLSKDLIASAELREILHGVMAAGGNWEMAFGGLLILHLPKAEMDLIAGKINNLGPSNALRPSEGSGAI